MPRIDEETGLEWRTVTYGVLPEKEEFDRRWARAMGIRRYRITKAGAWNGSYSREDLWAKLSAEVAAWDALTDETARDYDEQKGIAMVGDILGHFSWEWI